MTLSALDLSIHLDSQQYVFGNFTLRPDGTLLRDTAFVPLPPKELAVLRLLLSRPGEIVPASHLRQSAWGIVHVSPDSLPRCISSLRARLESEDCIQAVYKRGYRLNLPVKLASDSDEAVHEPLEDEPAENERAENKYSAAPWLTRTHALPRLAILPFTAGAGVPEFLGTGIAEEVMLRLSRLSHPVAEVLARDSVFILAARGNTAQQVGRFLKSDLAVTGTITALPRYYRLRAEMIRVSDAVQLWVEDFLIPRHLLIYADARIGKRIGARIRNTFTSTVPAVPSPVGSPATLGNRDARRSEAYAIVTQGKADWATFRLPQMQDAMRSFQRALELAPDLHSARTQLMHGYLALSSFGYMRADIAAELARKQAEILLAQSPSGHAAHSALGWIHFFHDRDLETATAFFSYPRSAGYNPWTPVYQARFALGQGRFSEALAILRAALADDPFSSVLHWRLAWALHLAGDAPAALEQAKRTLNLFPNDPGALFFAAIIFAASCDPESRGGDALGVRAAAVATRLVQAAPTLDAAYGTLAYVHARQGQIVEARALLDRQQWLSRDRFVMRCFEVPALIELGEYDAALDSLATAEKQHCPWLFELLGDPRLQPLYREPEFHRLGNLSGYTRMENTSVA